MQEQDTLGFAGADNYNDRQFSPWIIANWDFIVNSFAQHASMRKHIKENWPLAVLSLIGLVTLFGVTIWMWNITTVTSRERNLAIFDTLTQDNEHAMRGRIDLYRQSLDGGAALFEATEVVSLDQWKSYVEVLRIEETLPGINGIGFIMPVQRSKLADYLEFVRNNGVGNINIHPVTDSPEILSITYIEPVEQNKKAVGLDIGFEANRRNAAYQARDTGKATITQRITLVQDNTKSAGFLLLRPMYEQGRIPETEELRRAAFRGWIYAPFIASRFMAGLTKSQGKDFDIEVYDGNGSREANLIFASKDGEATDRKPLFSIARSFPVMGQTWTVIWKSTPDLEASISTKEPLLVLLGGMALSFAVMILMFIYARREAYVRHEVKIKTGELVQKEREVSQALADSEAATAAKSTFLANMSHEIRTPMNGVIGFTQLLDDGRLDDNQQRYVQMISESGAVMMNLLNDILDISKVDAGLMQMNSSPIDVRHILTSCMKLVSPTAETKQLDLIVTIDPLLPKLVNGDGLRLRQVILNLLANAVKFTKKGHVKLEANFRASRPGETDQNQRSEISICVSDTGIGIAPDRQAAVFEPFQQADGSTARKYGGTGLGLSISNQLVQLMGGEMLMKSQVLKGSSFTINIPVETCDGDGRGNAEIRTEQSDEPPRPSVVRARKTKILVAEDHDVNQMLLSEMLANLGFEFEIAENGVDAVAIIGQAKQDQEQFDLVLMDIQMPYIDGLKATEIIRNSGISADQLPIIALTANAYAQDIENCLAVGMQAHLAKPFSIEDLQGLIAIWVENEASAETEKVSSSLLV